MKLNALQGLRAYAAAMVVFVHAISTYSEKVFLVESMPLPQGLGELGVKIFFCISGFIIYNSSEKLNSGPSSAFEFITRRIIRIAPLYWMATLVYAAKLSAQGNPPGIIDLVKSLFFIPYADITGLMRPVLGVGWSLNFEMLFYITFFLAILIKTNARFYIVSTLLIIINVAHSAFATQTNLTIAPNPIYLISNYLLYYFLAGMLIAKIFEVSHDKKFWPRTTQTQSITYSSATIALYFIYTATNTIDALTLEWLMIACSVFCVFWCITEIQSSRQVRHPGSDLLCLAGDASYSTYLIHGFVMGPAARAIKFFNIGISPIVFSLTMILICTIVGILVHFYIEKPTLRYLNNIFKKKPRPILPLANGDLSNTNP